MKQRQRANSRLTNENKLLESVESLSQYIHTHLQDNSKSKVCSLVVLKQPLAVSMFSYMCQCWISVKIVLFCYFFIMACSMYCF